MADGKLLWSHQMTSADSSHYLSMPAMIVGDRVIYGTAGADWGGRGWIGAFRLDNGEARCGRRLAVWWWSSVRMGPGARYSPGTAMHSLCRLREPTRPRLPSL